MTADDDLLALSGAVATDAFFAQVPYRLGAGPVEHMNVTLRFDKSEPLTLSLVFPHEDGEEIWPLSRDTVWSALTYQGTIHGLGDVKLLYLAFQETLRVMFGPFDGKSMWLWLPFAGVLPFVRRTYDLCPWTAQGAILDAAVDATLARILGEGAAS